MSCGDDNAKSVGVVDEIFISPHTATDLACPVLNVTVFGTGSILSLYVDSRVSSIGVSELVANGAVSVTSIEVSVISHGNYNAESVGLLSKSLVSPSSTTVGAVPVRNVTVCSTGSSLSSFVLNVVLCLGIGFLVANHTNLVTSIEVLVSSLGSGKLATDRAVLIAVVIILVLTGESKIPVAKLCIIGCNNSLAVVDIFADIVFGLKTSKNEGYSAVLIQGCGESVVELEKNDFFPGGVIVSGIISVEDICTVVKLGDVEVCINIIEAFFEEHALQIVLSKLSCLEGYLEFVLFRMIVIDLYNILVSCYNRICESGTGNIVYRKPLVVVATGQGNGDITVSCCGEGVVNGCAIFVNYAGSTRVGEGLDNEGILVRTKRIDFIYINDVSICNCFICEEEYNGVLNVSIESIRTVSVGEYSAVIVCNYYVKLGCEVVVCIFPRSEGGNSLVLTLFEGYVVFVANSKLLFKGESGGVVLENCIVIFRAYIEGESFALFKVEGKNCFVFIVAVFREPAVDIGGEEYAVRNKEVVCSGSRSYKAELLGSVSVEEVNVEFTTGLFYLEDLGVFKLYFFFLYFFAVKPSFEVDTDDLLILNLENVEHSVNIAVCSENSGDTVNKDVVENGSYFTLAVVANVGNGDGAVANNESDGLIPHIGEAVSAFVDILYLAARANAVNIEVILYCANDYAESVGDYGKSLVSPELITIRAVPVLAVTVYASGSNSSNVLKILGAGSRNYNVLDVGKLCKSLIGPNLLAIVAYPVLNVTVSVAIGSSSFDVNEIALAGSGKDYVLDVGNLGESLVSPNLLTSVAYPVLAVTVVVASGSLCIEVNEIALAGSGNDKISEVGEVVKLCVGPVALAVCAVPVLYVTIHVASGSLSCKVNSVVRSLTSELAASYALCIAIVSVSVLAYCAKDYAESVSYDGKSCISPVCITIRAVPVLKVTVCARSRNSSNVLKILGAGSAKDYALAVGKSGKSLVNPVLFASVAVPVLYVTVSVAIGSSSLNVSNVALAGSGKDYVLDVGKLGKSLIGPNLLAIVAYPVLNVTVHVASGSLSLEVNEIALAGSGKDYALDVGKLSKSLVSPNLLAIVAYPVLDVTVVVASGSLSREVNEIALAGSGNDYAKRSNVLSKLCVKPCCVTDGTGPVLYVTVSVAVSAYSVEVNGGVLCVGVGELAAVLTGSVTGVGVLVLFGGKNYCKKVGVLGASLVEPCKAAILAIPVLDVTGLVTGSCLSLYVLDGVGEDLNNRGVLCRTALSGTVSGLNAGIQTGGGSENYPFAKCVTESVNSLGNGCAAAFNGTCSSLNACCSTGCGGGYSELAQGVAESGDRFGLGLAAKLAGTCSSLNACLSTGCGSCGHPLAKFTGVLCTKVFERTGDGVGDEVANSAGERTRSERSKAKHNDNEERKNLSHGFCSFI